MLTKPRFFKEPAYQHGQPSCVGVLLCNLGTPDAPTAKALRPYLAQFLGDPRVVEIPRWIWMFILHGIILRLRPPKSARKYASIWLSEGSPLKVWTERQAQALQSDFSAAGENIVVRFAMTYGQPSIDSQLNELKAAGANRILILPAYPQYSGTTTASVFDCVYKWAQHIRYLPELRFINHYHDDAGYIQSLANKVRQHWQLHGRGEKLVMSFHGVPERTLLLGDPYYCECHKTARLLAESLQLSDDQFVLTFQSRFGKAKWLQPYTEPTVRELAQKGTRKIDVICPGFTSDCLETLEEIAMEVKMAFIEEGGSDFSYIECLNADEDWTRALADIARSHLKGWQLKPVGIEELQISKDSAQKIANTLPTSETG